MGILAAIFGLVVGIGITYWFLQKQMAQQLQAQTEQHQQFVRQLEQEYQSRIQATLQTLQTEHEQRLQQAVKQANDDYQNRLQKATQALQAEYDRRLKQAKTPPKPAELGQSQELLPTMPGDGEEQDDSNLEQTFVLSDDLEIDPTIPADEI